MNIRPHALRFLKKMKEKFELIVFTASDKLYADAILNYLDPFNDYFDHKLYRNHCVKIHEDFYVKDLSIINRRMEDMVLVDNGAYSYIMQLDNGIPILPYYEGKDEELKNLEKYLLHLAEEEDMRQTNELYFKLHSYSDYSDPYELIE